MEPVKEADHARASRGRETRKGKDAEVGNRMMGSNQASEKMSDHYASNREKWSGMSGMERNVAMLILPQNRSGGDISPWAAPIT